MTGKRGHGRTAFLDVRDLSGTIQAYARLDALGEEAFGRLEDLDIGDIVGIDGVLHVTKRGQLALAVREATLLAKALRDPPDLFHGISDTETRYRRRELDLMANERSREVFKLRARVLAAIREHMNESGFVELETPILQRLTGGAAARPFKTYHHALDRHLFLRIATELYLKRAIVGGFEDVYELGKFFRNEGMSPEHNPEFTMLEWFVSGVDYNGVMDFAEGLVADVVERVTGGTRITFRGQEIDFATPWRRVSLRDALLEETGEDIVELSRDELAELAGDDADPDDDWAALADRLQGKLVEPKLDAADLRLRPAARHLAAGQAGALGARAARGGVRRDRRRDGDHRRRHRYQRPDRAAAPLRRTARAAGVGGRGEPARARRGVRPRARIRDADRERLRPRGRPADDDPQRLADAARRDPLPLDAGEARQRRGSTELGSSREGVDG